MDILDAGHWEDQVFVFDEPVDMGTGKLMRRVDVSGAELGPDITPEDVIHALLNRTEDVPE